ncbi:helix-turn-helix domain-containing protein [Clostridium paraputrificum]|uniref:helix-turn-helix domain-containing protein n=1 Tax=Clostridium paraputrificum TaxID=29363 RepID=UPI000C075F53|nr:helix-turn-helix domain-containing protein [Clostridium paraputrificum]
MDKLLNEIKELLEKNLTPKATEPKETLTVDEAVKLTGIGRDTILELIKKQNTDFPYFKVKSKNLINRTMLLEWLEKVTKEHRVI